MRSHITRFGLWLCGSDLFLMLLLLLGVALPAQAGVRQLAANARATAVLNNAGEVAWWDHGLYLWDGTTVRRLTESEGGAIQQPSQFSDGGQVAWPVRSGSGNEIDLWDGQRVRVLGHYAQNIELPRMSAAGQAVWEGDYQIYLWDGARTRQISGAATQNRFPRINLAGQVVWEGDGQIYLWDGAAVQRLTRPIPGHLFTGAEPQINASGQVTWVGALDEEGGNVYFWDGLNAWRLTQRGISAAEPLIDDAGQIVWSRRDQTGQPQELDLWDGMRIQRLTPEGAGIPFYVHYQINDRGQVVWDGQQPGDGFMRVFLWQEGQVSDLTGHQVLDPLPQLGEGGQVVWQERVDSTPELFLWDGQSVRQISNNRARGAFPPGSIYAFQINRAGQVSWSDDQGGVYLYTPAAPGSLELEPDTILEGRTALGTVTLPQPAPPGGAVVTLASDNPAVTVPPAVAIPEGETAATFLVTTTLVPSAATATVSASSGGSAWKAVLRITHTALAAVGFGLAQVTLTLDGPAPPGGAVVTVTSDHPEALRMIGDAPGLPAGTVTRKIPAGYNQATVAYWVYPVGVPTVVHVSASYGGVTRVATRSLVPPQLTAAGFYLDTAALFPGGPIACGGAAAFSPGAPVEGSVSLDGPAPVEGIAVALASDNPAAASVPATITVPHYANGDAFPITLHPVAASTDVHISATAGGVTRTLTLTVLSFELAAVTVDPGAVISGHPAAGTVSLSAPAPAAGVVIPLTADWPAWQPALPPAVTVPPGATSAQFPIAPRPVGEPVPLGLTACYAGVARRATLQVLPPDLVSFTLDPATARGGDAVTATATLNGGAPIDHFDPAPGAWLAITSSDPAVASAPARVNIPAGSPGVSFPISIHPVAAATTVMITAAYRGATRAAVLTILP